MASSSSAARGPFRTAGTVLVVMVSSLLVLFGLPAPAAFASGQTLWWSEDGNEFTTFGANAAVTIYQGTGTPGTCDGFGQYTNIYVVADSSLSDQQPLVDVSNSSGLPNTVDVNTGGGIFIDETIGFTAPGGYLGVGRYGVVYDECQDGKFDAGTDKLFYPAFDVTIPADIPPISPYIAALKSRAEAEANSWNTLVKAVDALELLIELKERIECVLGGVATCLLSQASDYLTNLIKSQAMELLGLQDPKEAAKDVVLDHIKHYGGIAADPPDPAFSQLDALSAARSLSTDEADPIAQRLVALGDATSTDGVLLQSLLHAIERYQGADAAGNGTWAVAHARAIQEDARALVTQLDASDAALTALADVVAADVRPLDSLASAAESFRTRVASSGFNAEETLFYRNAGRTDAQIAALRSRIAGQPTFTEFSRSALATRIDTVRSASSALRPVLSTLVSDMGSLVTHLHNDPGTVDTAPTADAGGPYAAAEGAPLAISAAGSSGGVASYAWDLDRDGAFDDATGSSVTTTFPRAFSGLIGLRVTGTNGQSDIAYARVTIGDTQHAPIITSSSPNTVARDVIIGASEAFSVTTSDADGDSVSVRWLLDEAPVGTGLTYAYAPSASDLGRHSLRAEASDGTAGGGTGSREWTVSALQPDADGDGYRANLDCDDTDPAVNPGRTEILFNGKDDDCDVATMDSGSSPAADFTPSGSGRNVALLEGGATVISRSSAYAPNHEVTNALNFTTDDYPWATTSLTDQYAIVGLADGRTWLVDRVKLMPRIDYADQRVRDFAVDVSTTTTDASAFTTVLTATAANTGELQEFALSSPVAAKYVRYRPLNNRGGCCNISTEQFKVFSSQAGSPTVTFTDRSTDAENDITSYAWDFGDGGTGTGSPVTHTYTAPGDYAVTLTVTDAYGHSGSRTLTQTVLPQLTVVARADTLTPREGDYIGLHATVTGGVSPILGVTWDFGDGTAGSGTDVAHPFAALGTRTVTARGYDSAEQVASGTVSITAVNVPPTVTIADDGLFPADARTTPINAMLSFTPTISDPGGAADPITCVWDYGDGGVSSSGACGFSHSYSAPGRYTATVTATDGAGSSTGASSVVVAYAPTGSVALTPISTPFNSPIGIDYHEPTNKIIMSVNYFGGGRPYNFELVSQDGSRQQFSTITGLTDEIKIASVKRSSCQGGFTPGELFTGTGVPGEIARISADGTTADLHWVQLVSEGGLMRGSLFQDEHCVVGGDLVVVTTAGGVWRVSSAGVSTKLAQISAHLEGLSTIPNEARYGPWAGKLLIGAEGQSRFYTVDPATRAVQSYDLGIQPEDIDIVPAGGNFFGTDFAGARLRGAPASAFADKIGDIVVAQEFPGNLWSLHWNAGTGIFERSLLAQVGQWEHVTFARAGIREIAPTNQAPVALDDSVNTPQDTARNITLQAADPDSDPLTYAIAGGPSHGVLSGLSGNTVTYTPTPGYVGPDTFTFRASDASLSDTATVSITVTAGNAAPTANAGGPYTVPEGGSITLDGTGSSDLDGVIVSYAWDIDGDGLFDDSTSATPPLTGVDGPATRTVGLLVTDNDGATDSAFVNVDVTNVAPTALASNDGPIDEGGAVNVSASQTDPGSFDTFTYAFDCDGDGTFAAYQASAVQACAFDQDGSYLVGVRVMDSDGGVGATTTSVVVRNVAPTALASNDGPKPWGVGISFLASATDVSAADQAALTYAWDFDGDGTLDTAPSPSPSAAHTYADPVSNLAVGLRVCDDDTCTVTSTVVTVTKHATTVAYGGAVNGTYSDPVAISATLTDSLTAARVAGAPIDFTVGTLLGSATTGATGIAATSLVLNQPAGTVGVNANFGGTSRYLASGTTSSLSVAPESAVVTYAGDTGVLGANPATLRAEVTEQQDGSIGSIRLAAVVFDVYPGASGCGIGTPTSYGPVPVNDGAVTGDGVGMAEATLLTSSGATYCVISRLSSPSSAAQVNAFYLAPPSDATGIVVYSTTDKFGTGGGWVEDALGRHSNFGYNARPQASGNPKGQSTLVYRGTYRGLAADITVKSTSLSRLDFLSERGNGTFPWRMLLEGKASVRVTQASDGARLFDDPTASFTLVTVDSGQSSGRGVDIYATRVLGHHGGVILELGAWTSTGGYRSGVLLSGGNEVVHLK